ncbi:TIGR04219 family outer membrane beta-barrel protein [Thalassotalea atypica]|uniref:TIGR04219 family outer membrane beta-barrel protein n=1 Tax=Thalassotalea atypica TaxID=2054316 RepID=UPI0025739F90|nr:TIGR04219 family outer membrane beta-barrel protein [Thalassotalea atypica]
MKKTLLALTLSCASILSFSAHADAVGLYIGGQVWDNAASGVFGESSDMVDFNLSDEQQGSYFIAIEHPFPFIPNVKLSSTDLETSGSTLLGSNFEFGGEDFASGSQASADFDLSYIDYTLYYELFDNGLFSFDVGLTARDFDGDISVSSTMQSTDPDGNPISETLTGSESISEIVPMLYAYTNIGLPLTGLNFFAEGNFLSFDDHMMYDYQAGISYELVDNLAIDVNVTAGYRAMKLELEDLDELYTDLEFDGLFAGVVVHF